MPSSHVITQELSLDLSFCTKADISWYIPFELGSWNFRVPSQKFQLEHPLKLDFQHGKTGEPHQPRPQNPICLLRASPYLKALVMYCLLALLTYLCVIIHSRPTVQLLSVDMLLQCLYAQNTA